MKLSDILEASWDELTNVTFPKNMRAHMFNKQGQGNNIPVGSGANAAVYRKDDPEHLNTVQRVSSAKGTDDRGYHAYAEFLTRYPGLRKNPYLPRLRKVEHTADNVVEYEVERLHPFHDERISHAPTLWALCNRIFTPDRVLKIKSAVANDMTSEGKEALKTRIIGTLIMAVNLRDTRQRETIQDPLLRQALRVISAVTRHDIVYPDIHEGNIMWRLTGTMPQLVITDPLFQHNERRSEDYEAN
jgi:hypothetical protein